MSSGSKLRWSGKRVGMRRLRGRRHLFEPLEDRLLLAVDASFSAYDVLGNVSMVRDALGNQTLFEHDALGRLTSVQGPNQNDFVRLTYDPNGNVTRMHDATGYTFYDYDDFDRLTSVARSADAIFGNQDDQLVGYSYDAVGNIDTLTYPDGAVVDYDYDAVNRLSRVAQGDEVTSYTYFADGLLATMTLPNAVTATYGYDFAGRLQDLVYRNGSNQLVSSFHYTFDANSNRTSMEVRRPNLDTPDPSDIVSELYQYGYDARNQLVEARYPDGSVVTYAYDGAGNRTRMTTDPDGTGPQPAQILNYHHDVENRLTHTTDATGTIVTRYEYDARGNRVAEITAGETTTYEYDYRNLLVRVNKGTTVVRYEYDGRGDRVARIENGARTDYVNDVNRLYTQVLQEIEGSGQGQSRYVYGAQRIAGLLLGETRPVYFLADAIGSTTDLSNEDGITSLSYTYDAFGGFIGGLSQTPFLFAGEALDNDTGLIYLRARFYDSVTGTFLTKDPAGFLDGPNGYEYVGNNPTSRIDPSGLLYLHATFGGTITDGAGLEVSAGVAINLSSRLILAAGNPSKLDAASGLLREVYESARADKTIAPSVGKLIGAGPSFGVYRGSTLDVAGDSLNLNLQFAKVGVTFSFGADGFQGLAVSGPGRAGASVSYARTSAGPTLEELYLQRHYLPADDPSLIDAGFLYPASRSPVTGGESRSTSRAYSVPSTPSQSASNAANRGGVLLDFPAQFIGNISSLTGATVDAVNAQVVLLGEQAAGVPSLVLDDFVSALRAVYGSIKAPGVTINQPASGDPEDPQTVEYFAGVEDTHLGYVFFEADRVLKSLAAGRDNITGHPVSSSVPGYKSMAQRWADSYDPGNPNQTHNVRWWFKVSDMKLVRTADGKSFEFADVGLQLVAEDADTGHPATDPDAVAFAQWFTNNFDAIAAEPYPHPTLPGMEHPLLRLKQAAESVAFAQFLRENNIPVDFSWIDAHQLAVVDTPDTTPTVVVQTPVGGAVSVFYGGINLGALPEYLTDESGAVHALAADARQMRPSDLAQDWQLSNQTTTALAVSLSPDPRDGNLALADTDLEWATVGENPLAITRYYNSFRPVPGPLGYGWELLPSELEFELPAYQNSGQALNGLREGTIRFLDRLSGQTLSFRSTLEVVRHGDGTASYTGLTGGVPAFVPADLRDGSTLELSPDRSTYTLIRPNSARQTFDGEGRLLSQTDRHGNAIAYGRSGGRLTTISDATGVVFDLSYDEGGRLSRVEGPAGERVDYSYDSEGHLVSATRARGPRQYTYQYDADHRMTGSTGPNGRARFGTELDIRNRATSRTDLRGNVVQFDYGFAPATATRITTAQDATSGFTTHVGRDLQNRPTAVTDVLGRVQSYGYDPSSSLRNPTRIQAPDLERPGIQLRYDNTGNLLSYYDPANDPDGDGVTESFVYDSRQNLVRHVDARGIVTSFGYDPLNNLTEVQRADARWIYQYTVEGRLAEATDPLDHTTRYFYDATGNLVKIRDAANAETIYTYDALNRLKSITDPCGRTVTAFYNDLDQVVRVLGPLGEVQKAYDPVTHQLTALTDSAGNTTTYAYEPATGDLLSMTVAGASTTFTYDRFGQIASLRDAEGTETKFLYDELNRPIGAYTAFDETVGTLRNASQPWAVVAGTLVIAGFDEVDNGDIIILERDEDTLWLIVNERSFSLAAEVFDAIYVDAGDGDDLVDMRATPAAISVTILGGSGCDILLGGAGPDLILGGDEADWLEGGPGADWLLGGDGSDVIFAHTSARRQLFSQLPADDAVFGEAGNDLLFSRDGDNVQGGAGADTHYGMQENGLYQLWSARDIPLGLAGRLLLLGGEQANDVSIKILDGEYLLVTVNEQTHVLHVDAFDFVSGLFSEILVLTAGGNDKLDFRDAPVPVLIVAGAGDDQALGGNITNRIFGGPGADHLQGGGGGDTILDGSGPDIVDGGEGSDRLWGSSDASEDVFRAAGGANYILPGPGDPSPATSGQDLVVPYGQQPPPMPVQVPPQIAQQSNTVATSQPPRSASPTLPPQISEFSLRPATVVLGDSFDVVIRPSSNVQWARLEITADTNGNGRYDQGIDPILFQYRGQASTDIGTQIGTWRLGAGTFTVFARLLYYDGSATPWAQRMITILDAPPPPALPARITLPPVQVQPIIPLRNGDATIGGRELRSMDQFDLFEVSWGMSNTGARIWTTGNTDTIVAVYDDTGTRIAMDDDNGPGSNGEVLLSVAANRTYYVAVRAARDVLGSYTLEMTGPNQTFSDIETPPGNYVGTGAGSITASHRVDYFRIVAPQGASLVNFSATVGAGLGVWLRLEDWTHRVIGTADSSRPGQNQYRTNVPVTGGETYFLTVYGLYGTTGDYTVNVDFYPDELGFANTITVYPLPPYEPLIPHADGDYTLPNLAISSPGEFDYFFFQPPRSGEYTLQTTGTTDVMMALYNGGGWLKLAEDDSSGGGANARIVRHFSNREQYWVVVRATGNTTGLYELQLIGPDQEAEIINPAGLRYQNQAMKWINGTAHFVTTAPLSATTLDVVVTRVGTRDLDVWFTIEDEAGVVTGPANAGGVNVVEQITGYPVVGGRRYWITVHGWDQTIGDAVVLVDFDPDFVGTDEIPLATTTDGYQRSPAVAMNHTGQSVFVWGGQEQFDFDDLLFFQRFDPAGNPVGYETTVNSDQPARQYLTPAVGMDALGNFVIAWSTDGRVYARQFNAQGVPLAATFDVGFAPTGDLEYTHAIAVAPNGAFMVVGAYTRSLYGRLFNAAGQPVTGVLNLDNTLDAKAHVSLAADGEGKYVVAWTAYAQNVSHIYAVRIDAAGNVLNDRPIGHTAGQVDGYWFHDANQNGLQEPGEGGIAGVTVFLDANRNGILDAGERTTLTDPDGAYRFTGVASAVYSIRQQGGGSNGPAAVGDDFNRPDNTDLGPQWIELSGDFRIENNRVVAPTNDHGTIVYQGTAGLDQTVMLDLFDLSSSSRAGHMRLELARADASNFLSVGFDDDYWSADGPKFNKLFLRYGNDGNPWPRMKLPNSIYTYFDITPFSSARVMASYNSAAGTLVVGVDANFDGVYEQMYHAGGIPSERLGTGVAIGEAREVAFDNFVIDHKIIAVPQPSVTRSREFRVDPDLAAYQYGPSVGANASGQFVVAWGSSPDRNTYAQRYDAQAREVGPWLRLNELTPTDSRQPSVSLKDNGEFVVTWASNGLDGSGFGVYARQYDAAGNPATLEEFLVNSTTTGNQWWPAVAGNGRDRFGFAWQHYKVATFEDDVIGRFMDLPTPTPHPILAVTTPEAPGTPHVDFDRVLVGSSPVSRLVRVSNRGTAVLEGSITLAGPDADRFQVSGSSPFSLAPGASYDHVVDMFLDRRGTYTAELILQTNADVVPLTVPINGAVVPGPDVFEPNNSRAAAVELGTITAVALSNLSLHDGLDQDWFAFEVEKITQLRITAHHAYAEGDLDISLRDDAGIVLAASSTVTDDEVMLAMLLPDRRYYLQVYSTGPAANVYDLHVVVQDDAPPRAAVSRRSPFAQLTNADTVVFDVTFSESVRYVDAADFRVVADGTLTATAGVTVGDAGDQDASTYTVTVRDLAGDGRLWLEFAAAADIEDYAGHLLDPVAESSEEYTVDNTPPTVEVIGLITADATPAISGTVDDGSLSVTVNGKTYVAGDGYLNLAGGTWTLQIPATAALIPGTYEVSARAVDAAGNVGTGAGELLIVMVGASIADRRIFYNGSSFDGNDPAPNSADDGAIAPDKTALLPGQTATFANYTSYSRGINGIMVDIHGLANPGTLSVADFEFRVGNSAPPSDWTAAPAPISITVRAAAGRDGSDRVTLIWAVGAIRNQWLQVTVLPDATGLVDPDVFYFGNAVGDSGNSALNTSVDGSDFAGARDNPRNVMNPALIDFRWDYNRDRNVDGTDLAVARDNATNFLTALRLITAPPSPSGNAPAAPAGAAPAGSEGESADRGGVLLVSTRGIPGTGDSDSPATRGPAAEGAAPGVTPRSLYDIGLAPSSCLVGGFAAMPRGPDPLPAAAQHVHGRPGWIAVPHRVKEATESPSRTRHPADDALKLCESGPLESILEELATDVFKRWQTAGGAEAASREYHQK